MSASELLEWIGEQEHLSAEFTLSGMGGYCVKVWGRPKTDDLSPRYKLAEIVGDSFDAACATLLRRCKGPIEAWLYEKFYK